MRLFYGVELNDSEKESIKEMLSEQGQITESGRQTDWQNYHLTVRFIGRVSDDDLEKYKLVIDQLHLPSQPIEMLFDRIGTFHKKKGNIIWLGSGQKAVQISGILTQLENIIDNEAPRQVEDFVTHITLARNFKDEISISVKPIPISIDNITLFESKRIDGVLRYIPIHQKKITHE